MASARSGGRVGPRDEEANGDLDRSLQQMLRAIAEERSRAGLRQEISGLGESAAGASPPAGRETGGAAEGRARRPGVPLRAGTGSPRLRGAAGWVGRLLRPVLPVAVARKPVVCVLPGCHGDGPFSLPKSPRNRREQLSAPLSEMPLEENGQKAPRTSANVIFIYIYIYLSISYVSCVLEYKQNKFFVTFASACGRMASQLISVDYFSFFSPLLSQTPPFAE